jgi:vitamin B12/bleomycin/antimicrobial peptide transport system ATP-binding/permease protein
MRSLAQLWPFTSGTVRYPTGENETMLLSQLPHVPLGDLRTVVSHPHRSGDISDERFRAAMQSVALPRYTGRLDGLPRRGDLGLG